MTQLMLHDTGHMPLFRRARRRMNGKRVNVLVDIGPGIRPQRMMQAKRSICVEPHGEYADVLERNGYEVMRSTAGEALAQVGQVDAIIALDVIEHMTRAEGLAFLAAAVKIARQVVVFTPLGFMEQDGGDEADPWGLQGQEWQKHRSGWTPADFPGWHCVVDPNFHKRHGRGAFFAIWSR